VINWHLNVVFSSQYYVVSSSKRRRRDSNNAVDDVLSPEKQSKTTSLNDQQAPISPIENDRDDNNCNGTNTKKRLVEKTHVLTVFFLVSN
jgi:hypothetical protein